MAGRFITGSTARLVRLRWSDLLIVRSDIGRHHRPHLRQLVPISLDRFVGGFRPLRGSPEEWSCLR